MVESGIVGLAVLEEKINKAADLISRLSREKNEVEEQNKELKGKIESLYIKNKELAREIKMLKKEKDHERDFDKTREEIESKIEGMLTKLEGMDL